MAELEGRECIQAGVPVHRSDWDQEVGILQSHGLIL